MSWREMDQQLAHWAMRLQDEVRIAPEAANKLATTIAADVRFLSTQAKAEIKSASPVPLGDRLNELKAFQGWMDQARQIRSNPFVTRAQVLTQNYICFVYLPESCFRVLAKWAPNNSATKLCAKFLSDNPIRAFRNAVAHANWTYRDDFGGIIYWARKGNDPNEPLVRFNVSQDELNFWQSLSRCVAYTSFSNL
ncbi:MAG TPA: hypothetical protein VIJ78_09910 [Pseudolabrys sp.]